MWRCVWGGHPFLLSTDRREEDYVALWPLPGNLSTITKSSIIYFLTCTSHHVQVNLEACMRTVFVVLHFRMYVTKLVCIR